MPETWRIEIPPRAAPEVRAADGTLVATCHRERPQAIHDAILLAHAPSLLAAVRHLHESLGVMAECDAGPSGFIAQQLRGLLEELLRGPLSAVAGG